jgi:site-specific recombinase XerD
MTDLLARLRLSQERRGVLENSIVAREGRVKALMAWMEPQSIFDASRADVEAFLDSRNLVSSSRRCYLSHLHAFYAWAIDEELTTEDPTAKITRPKLRRATPRPISDESLSFALKLAPDNQIRCFLLLGALQGLRCQEIAGLSAEDIDRQNETLFVRHGKGGKERTLPLHPTVAAALPTGSGRLFRLRDGRPMKAFNVSHVLNEHLRACGIDDTAHALRHAFGTTLYRATKDLRLTQEMMGHSSPQTTSIYAACDMDGAKIVKTLWADVA